MIGTFRNLLAAAAGALLVACAANVPVREREPGVLGHVPHETTADGDKVVVVRDYFEPRKIDGKDDDRRVQYVWNYTRGVTQRRLWSADGLSFEATDMPGMTLNATADELDYAYAIVRADPRYADVITSDTYFHGGFSVREPDSPCDDRARCIHVFGVRDAGRKRVLHAIFALGTGKIIDHDYDPALGGLGERLDKNPGVKQ